MKDAPTATAEQIEKVRAIFKTLPQHYLTEEAREAFGLIIEDLSLIEATGIITQKESYDVVRAINLILKRREPEPEPEPVADLIETEPEPRTVEFQFDEAENNLSLCLLQSLMTYPVFTLRPVFPAPDGKGPAVEFKITERGNSYTLKLFPSAEYGTATVFDLSLFIYILSRKRAEMMLHKLRFGHVARVDRRIKIKVSNALRALGKNQSGQSYADITAAFERLLNTKYQTEIPSLKVGNKGSWITNFGYEKDGKGKLKFVEVQINENFYDALKDEGRELLTIDPEFNKLNNALARRLYLIARKGAGSGNAEWGLDKIAERATDSPTRERRKIKADIAALLKKTDGCIAGYKFSLEADKLKMEKIVDIRTLSVDTEEKTPKD